jgi:hypothetical protein
VSCLPQAACLSVRRISILTSRIFIPTRSTAFAYSTPPELKPVTLLPLVSHSHYYLNPANKYSRMREHFQPNKHHDYFIIARVKKPAAVEYCPVRQVEQSVPPETTVIACGPSVYAWMRFKGGREWGREAREWRIRVEDCWFFSPIFWLFPNPSIYPTIFIEATSLVSIPDPTIQYCSDGMMQDNGFQKTQNASCTSICGATAYHWRLRIGRTQQTKLWASYSSTTFLR